MHIRSTESNISHRRSFKSAGVAGILSDDQPAEIGFRLFHSDADVVIFFISEIGPDMAGRAVSLFGKEDFPTPFCFLRHGMGTDARLGCGKLGREFGVVGNVVGIQSRKAPQLFVVVVRGWRRDKHAFKCRDCLADAIDGEVTKNCDELLVVDGYFFESGDDACVSEAHFYWRWGL